MAETKLPSDRWFWQTEWFIDRVGDVDADGWQVTTGHLHSGTADHRSGVGVWHPTGGWPLVWQRHWRRQVDDYAKRVYLRAATQVGPHLQTQAGRLRDRHHAAQAYGNYHCRRRRYEITLSRNGSTWFSGTLGQ